MRVFDLTSRCKYFVYYRISFSTRNKWSVRKENGRRAYVRKFDEMGQYILLFFVCFDQIEVDHSLGSSSDLSKQYINCYPTLSVAENIRRNQGSTRYRWRSYRRSCVVWMFSWNVSIRVLISDCLTDISHLWPNKMCECTLSLYLVNIKDNNIVSM